MLISNAALARIDALAPARLVVGFSGGVDSHVLLHELAASRFAGRLHALHINHGLSQESDGWQGHCESVCAALGVGFTAIRVEVAGGSGIEAKAREARYAAYREFLGTSDLLLLAHHVDDQVETALLGLMRGSGKPGLHGMPFERAIGDTRLLRPLLDVTREQIEAYATSHGLGWIEDASNQDTSFNRNYLRHEILPRLVSRWPDVNQTILAAIHRDRKFSQLIESIGDSDLDSLLLADGGILVAGFAGLPQPRRSNLVRTWLARFGLPMPGDAMLDNELAGLTDAREDAAPLLTWQGVCLRRYGEEIYLTDEVVEPSGAPYLISGEAKIDIGAGEVIVRKVTGGGVALEKSSGLVIGFREGGEKLQLSHHRDVKKLLQELRVPPWLRPCLPLIFQGDSLVAIAGLPGWQVPMQVAAGYEPPADGQGLEIVLNIPNQPYSD